MPVGPDKNKLRDTIVKMVEGKGKARSRVGGHPGNATARTEPNMKILT